MADLSEWECDFIQYSYVPLDLEDGRHEDVRLEYDGKQYAIEIQDGEPVVVEE
jgi:hypothetical protein